MTTKKEAVITVFDDDKNLVGIVYKDEKTRHNILYRVEMMDFDEIGKVLDNDMVERKVENNNNDNSK